MTVSKPIADFDVVHKFGSIDGVDIVRTPEDVWDGGDVYPFPSAAAETTIASTDANDAAAGTGARTVRVYGLDSDYKSISEDVTLDGTNDVTLSNQYLRCFRMKVLTAGSHETNVGDLQVKHGSTVITQITADEGQTLMAIYTVPDDGQKMFLVKWYVTCGKKKTTNATIKLQMRGYGGAWQTKEVIQISNTSGDWQYEYPVPLRLSPKTDIRVRIGDVAADGTDITAGFDIVY